jgi:uncharacterized protein (DUF1778 family)
MPVPAKKTDLPLLRMSLKGFDQFTKVISAPGKPVRALVKLFRRKAPWENAVKRD